MKREPFPLRIFWMVWLAGSLLLAGCGHPTSQDPGQNQATLPQSTGSSTLLVFAATSLTQPFTELGTVFEAQHPGTKVSFNFQNANTLAQQVEQGAPADVFASAAEKFMASTVAAGRVNAGDVRVFARNKLVVIFPKNNPASIQALGDLVKPGVKIVVGAREGPQGVYVEEFLTKASQDAAFTAAYKQDFYDHVVSYESTVNGVVTKVALGEADAGIVFFSDSQGSAAEKVGTLEIPDALNVEARYPIAILNDRPDPALAQAFVDLVLSATGQQVLQKYGFQQP